MSLGLATRGFLSNEGGGTSNLVDVASLTVPSPNTIQLRFNPTNVSLTDFGKLHGTYKIEGTPTITVVGVAFSLATRVLSLATTEQTEGASYTLQLPTGVVMTASGLINRVYSGAFTGVATPAPLPVPSNVVPFTRWLVQNISSQRQRMSDLYITGIASGGGFTTYNLYQADRLVRFARAGNLFETRYADHSVFTNRTSGEVSLTSLDLYLEPGDSITAPTPANPLPLEALQAAGWVTITRS